MRVVGFNGSARKGGNTALLLRHVFAELEKEGIETGLVELSGKRIHGCFSSGSGVLMYNGQRYLFKIDGLSVGNVGIASISAVGNVYNLNNVSQFAGNYAAAGAGIALAGGAAGLTMQNQSGVIINLYAVQQGVQLNIGPQGFNISMQ